eukprot:jgi/Mesvir1/27398/Mv07202-RA.2
MDIGWPRTLRRNTLHQPAKQASPVPSRPSCRKAAIIGSKCSVHDAHASTGANHGAEEGKNGKTESRYHIRHQLELVKTVYPVTNASSGTQHSSQGHSHDSVPTSGNAHSGRAAGNQSKKEGNFGRTSHADNATIVNRREEDAGYGEGEEEVGELAEKSNFGEEEAAEEVDEEDADVAPQAPIYSGSRFSRRTLGIDYGAKRTGIAVTCGGLAPRPLTVLTETDAGRLIEGIIAIAEEERADEIVVGFPRKPVTYGGGGPGRTITFGGGRPVTYGGGGGRPWAYGNDGAGGGGGGGGRSGMYGQDMADVQSGNSADGTGMSTHNQPRQNREMQPSTAGGNNQRRAKPFSYGTSGISPHARQCRRFAQQVERAVAPRGWRVVLFDEAHSSKDAMEDMLAFGSNRSSRKDQLDAYAAAVLLKNYFAADCKGEVVTPAVPLTWKEQRAMARANTPPNGNAGASTNAAPAAVAGDSDATDSNTDGLTSHDGTEAMGSVGDGVGEGVVRRRRRRRRKKATGEQA